MEAAGGSFPVNLLLLEWRLWGSFSASGDGVNVAARLEALAESGGVCLSGAVFDAIGHALPLDYSFLGEREVKNITKPVRGYQARLKPDVTLPPPSQELAYDKRKPERSRTLAAAVPVSILAVLAVTVLLWTCPWQDHDHVADDPQAIVQTGGKPAIAALPFENISDDPAQEFYADGMTGDRITELSKLSGLAVIARHSVFVYKDQPTALAQIARELGVRYVLEGNIRSNTRAHSIRQSRLLPNTDRGVEGTRLVLRP